MKTILITGASSGIGRSTATYFAEKGWNVVATMRSPEKEVELNRNSHILVTKLDVEQQESIQDAITKGVEKFGKIDVLLNNAGYGTVGIFEGASDKQIRRQFEVNVFGLMNTTKAMLPHFRANKAGIVINISSMGGIMAFPSMSLYHATKFAVEGFSESLSYELAQLNIGVKLIEPGSIRTDFSGRSMEFLFNEAPQEYKGFIDTFMEGVKRYRENPRITYPEAVAEVIYQAATDGSAQLRYVVGDDAKELIALKQQSGDAVFVEHITKKFL